MPAIRAEYDSLSPTHTKRHGHRSLPPTSARPRRHPWSWSSGSSTEEFLAAWHKFGSSLGGTFQRLASNSQGLLFYRMQLAATTIVHSRRCTKKAALGLATTAAAEAVVSRRHKGAMFEQHQRFLSLSRGPNVVSSPTVTCDADRGLSIKSEALCTRRCSAWGHVLLAEGLGRRRTFCTGTVPTRATERPRRRLIKKFRSARCARETFF